MDKLEKRVSRRKSKSWIERVLHDAKDKEWMTRYVNVHNLPYIFLVNQILLYLGTIFHIVLFAVRICKYGIYASQSRTFKALPFLLIGWIMNRATSELPMKEKIKTALVLRFMIWLRMISFTADCFRNESGREQRIFAVSFVPFIEFRDDEILYLCACLIAFVSTVYGYERTQNFILGLR
eukprot:745764-Hanusia_phi.AAC.2